MGRFYFHGEVLSWGGFIIEVLSGEGFVIIERLYQGEGLLSWRGFIIGRVPRKIRDL